MRRDPQPRGSGLGWLAKYDGTPAEFHDRDHLWRDYGRQAGFVAEVARMFRTPRHGKILDLCCGSGLHALPLARRGYCVTGADLSRILIRRALGSSSALRNPPRFLRADLFSGAFKRRQEGRFAGAFLLGWTLAIEPMARRFAAILETARAVLRPSGWFVFDAPIGDAFHPIPRSPLRYAVSPDLRATLSIQRSRRASRVYRYEYDWTIERRRRGRWQAERLTVREDLRAASDGELRSQVEGSPFRAVLWRRDYDLRKPYRKGDRNCVAVLEKIG